MMSEAEVQALVDKWIPYCIEYVQSGRKEKKKKISGTDRNEIESHAGEKCPTCTEKMVPQPHTGRIPKKGDLPEKHGITVEHIIPRVLGGDNRRLNLVAMCHRCNQCRNAVMNEIIPHLPTIRGSKLQETVRDTLSRYVEWSIRTIHTPNSNKVDTSLSELFEKEKIDDESRQPRMIARARRRAAKSSEKAAKRRTAKISKKEKTIASDEVLEVLKEILETQKAILARLQKSPLRRFRDWIFGFLPSKKPRPKVDSRSKKHEEKKSRRRRNRGRRISEGKTTPSNQPHLEPNYKYFCPECNDRFRKWNHALTHKSETGHCSHICDDCSSFLVSDKRKNEHEIQTGHTSFSGNYFSQQQMSIKHYNPDNSISEKLSLDPTRKVAEIESLATPPKQSEIKQDEGDFPLVDSLNTSRKGLRLPREPKQLAIVLMWFAENAHKYQSTEELKAIMSSESIIGKTRGNYLLTKLYYIYLPKSNGGISTADWSSIKVIDSLTLFDKLHTFAYQYLLEKQVVMSTSHSDYFAATHAHLS